MINTNNQTTEQQCTQGDSTSNSSSTTTTTTPITTLESVLEDAKRREQITTKLIELFKRDDISTLITNGDKELRKDFEQVWLDFGFSDQKEIEQLAQQQDKQVILDILTTLLKQIKDTIHLINDKLSPSSSSSSSTSTTISKSIGSDNKELTVCDFFDRVFKGKLQSDSKEALSYVTPYTQAIDVSNHVLKLFKHLFRGNNRLPSYIYDATGGIGGNTFGFLDALRTQNERAKVEVTSVEMDSKRFQCLKHNLNVYSDIYSNFKGKALEGNFLELWKLFPQHEKTNSLVMIDAPWGNSDYSKHDIIYDLFLFDNHSQKSINDLSRELIYESNVSMVVLKVPMQYSEMNLIHSNNNNNADQPLTVQSYYLRKSKYLILYK